MSKSQRDKGARFERRVVNTLRALGFRAERILTQVRDGGADIAWTHGQIECKCGGHVPATIYKWLAQNDADLLVVKRDRKRPVLMGYLDDVLPLIAGRDREGK